jgi:hypothetical protein
MRIRRFALVAVAALFVPAVAAAKGPSEATISGPGLAAPLQISGTEGSGDLGQLVSETGFFPATFGQSPNPLLRKEPLAWRGPEYSIVYRVPGPNTIDTLTQELFPYAVGGPLSHMRAGQKFWGDQRTRGGWYRGTAALKQLLVRAGLPAKAPTGERSARTSARIAAAAAVGAALAAAAAIAMKRRRR